MKHKPFFWVARQIRSRIPAIAVMTAAQMGNALLGVLFALGTRNIIDAAAAGSMRMFYTACGRQALVIVGILLSLTLTRHLREKLTAELEWDWKKRLLHGLLHGDYASVSSYHSAELLNRLNNDVTKVDDGILSIIPSAAAMMTRLVSAVVVLGLLDTTFMLLVLLAGAGVIGVTALMRRKLKELNRQVSEHDGKVSAYLQEIMEKLLMVQAMDVSREVERRAEEALRQRYQVQRKRKNVSLVTHTGLSMMTYGATFFAMVWCAFRLLRGQLSFGALTAVLQLVGQLQVPFVNLSGVLPKYAAMAASAERLMELDDIQGEPQDAMENPADCYQSMGTIQGENLHFSYDREKLLKGASFCLPKGSFSVITGSSGIGKSTLLKLMLGIFTPEQGQLRLCGLEKSIPIDRSTRRMFAYVPQGSLLLSGSLRENLLIVRPDAAQEQLDQAVYVSAMDEFLPTLPQGLDTRLGENNAGLSEGQAQRLAIARAVLGGAPILLLDECTSALDTQTEQLVLKRLRELPDRTCIAVTHRPAAIALCHWQLEIRDGQIIQKRILPE